MKGEKMSDLDMNKILNISRKDGPQNIEAFKDIYKSKEDSTSPKYDNNQYMTEHTSCNK